MSSTSERNINIVQTLSRPRTLPKPFADSQLNQTHKRILRENNSQRNVTKNLSSTIDAKKHVISIRDVKKNLNSPEDIKKGLISPEDTKILNSSINTRSKGFRSLGEARKNLHSPRNTSRESISPRDAKRSLNSSKDTRNDLISPRYLAKSTNSQKNAQKSPSSKWEVLAHVHSLKTSSPRTKTYDGYRLITADELLARKFSPEIKADPKQRSDVFLKAVQMFEGSIPEKLLKQEQSKKNIANEKLDFCSNEMVDMKKFIEQVEFDFLSIRDRIERIKENMVKLKHETDENAV